MRHLPPVRPFCVSNFRKEEQPNMVQKIHSLFKRLSGYVIRLVQKKWRDFGLTTFLLHNSNRRQPRQTT
ncbi:hypothetical protein Y032_0014g2216 [Ancylostoma ceylanicum]|uniref:Uncharacterized protein n=1 Tax=Ancylostoma ceylanicum TaxID=53326 RepID=A0A016V9G7_9BILA|nr:hypothetical protein Y032_0014g2216 [Ancylostoma ceylanicum]